MQSAQLCLGLTRRNTVGKPAEGLKIEDLPRLQRIVARDRKPESRTACRHRENARPPASRR